MNKQNEYMLSTELAHPSSIDLSGMQFGRLRVIAPTHERRRGCISWICECSCGKSVTVSGDALRQGYKKSCNCLQTETRKQNIKKIPIIEGTNVKRIARKTINKNNKTGYRGIQKINENKYRVMIGFKGKTHHLGYFTNINDAVAERTRAEERFYDAFLAKLE